MENKKAYFDFIDSQMKYFDSHSIKEKKRYYILSIASLLANATIPVISTASSIPSPYKQIVAILSCLAAIFTGLQMIFNSRSNWKLYRDNYTDLETILRGYNCRVGEFKELSDEDAFGLFYAKCESVLKRDRETWEPGKEKK